MVIIIMYPGLGFPAFLKKKSNISGKSRPDGYRILPHTQLLLVSSPAGDMEEFFYIKANQDNLEIYLYFCT